jgi:hypothetical protein
MKIHNIFWAILLLMLVVSCQNKKKIPNVNHIKVELMIDRFDKEFANINLAKISEALDTLQLKYNTFLPDYLFKIMGLPPQADSVTKQIGYFLKDSFYKQIQSDAAIVFKNLDAPKAELQQSLQFVKYYFPNYQLPNKLVTFVGPIDGIGCAITTDHNLAIGLQGYLGANYSAYNNSFIAQIYPSYKTKRFAQNYIAFNCIKNIIDEMYPQKFVGRPLAERVVELGKKMFVIDAVMPNTPDSVKLGYTQFQLDECTKNEAVIWAFFVQSNLLFEKENSIIMSFVNDGPKTPELSENSPGNIGQFTGWQIVKKWMEQHKQITLQQLMQTPAITIFNEANYKP